MVAEGIAVPWVIIVLLNQLGTYNGRAGVLGKEEQVPRCKLCWCPFAAHGFSHASQRRHKYFQVLPLSGGITVIETVISGLGAVPARGSHGSSGTVHVLGCTSPF